MLYGLDWSTCQSELSEVEKKFLQQEPTILIVRIILLSLKDHKDPKELAWFADELYSIAEKKIICFSSWRGKNYFNSKLYKCRKVIPVDKLALIIITTFKDMKKVI
jgi:hypothetical protein